jgi:predicted transcriptional regulator
MMRSRHSTTEAIADILRASTDDVGTSWGGAQRGFSNGDLEYYLSFLLAQKFIVPVDSESLSHQYKATDKGAKLLRVIDSIS